MPDKDSGIAFVRPAEILRQPVLLREIRPRSKLRELWWRARPPENVAGCPQERAHRLFVAARMNGFLPFGSILEVRCGAGVNLLVFAREYPGARRYGTDIRGRMLEAAEAALAQAWVVNARAFVGRADDLRWFAERSIDVVLTDAVLMYLGPEKIRKTIAELTRVARKGLILNE